jgi:hypothetical protein
VASHDDQYANYWLRLVVAGDRSGGTDAGSRPLYEVVYNTEISILPRQLDDVRDALGKQLKVME